MELEGITQADKKSLYLLSILKSLSSNQQLIKTDQIISKEIVLKVTSR